VLGRERLGARNPNAGATCWAIVSSIRALYSDAELVGHGPNVMASNGIVHVINGVLIPPAAG
jgi:hypothetical protein